MDIVSSITVEIESFLVNHDGNGNVTYHALQGALKRLEPRMSPAMRLMWKLNLTPHQLSSAVERSLRLRPVGDRGEWLSISYRRHSSMQYLRRPGEQLLIHPFDHGKIK